MNVAPSEKQRHQKVLRLFLVFQFALFAPIIIGSFFGCARTVETEVLHDTDTVIQHDTDTINYDGPAWIRFINLLTKGGVIVLKTDLVTPTGPFANATQIMGNEFIPIRGDTSMVLYTEYYIGTEFHLDSITIPSDSLKPHSLSTIVLFQVEQDGISRISPFFANDSLRKEPAPPGKAYFRFINGIADHPQPSPTVHVYADDPLGKPLFLDASGTNSRPVSFLELRNYVLVPEGNHTLYIRQDSDSTTLYSVTKSFRAGRYYTGKLIGSKTNGNDAFAIDDE